MDQMSKVGFRTTLLRFGSGRMHCWSISEFLNERVFGARRKEVLLEDFGSSDERADRRELNHVDALKKAVDQIETAQARLITKLELDDDPEGILFQRVRTCLSELEDERREKISTLQELEASRSETPDAEAVTSWTDFL